MTAELPCVTKAAALYALPAALGVIQTLDDIPEVWRLAMIVVLGALFGMLGKAYFKRTSQTWAVSASVGSGFGFLGMLLGSHYIDAVPLVIVFALGLGMFAPELMPLFRGGAKRAVRKWLKDWLGDE